jgi:lactate dehydrogenase-like 2-hydroxyacid dehydrogenase
MKIGILGAGKIGTTIATLLESCKFCTSVVPCDERSKHSLRFRTGARHLLLV